MRELADALSGENILPSLQMDLHMVERERTRGRKSSLVSYKSTNPIRWTPPSWPNYLQKTPTPNITTQEMTVSTSKFWRGNILSIAHIPVNPDSTFITIPPSTIWALILIHNLKMRLCDYITWLPESNLGNTSTTLPVTLGKCKGCAKIPRFISLSLFFFPKQ